MKAPSIDTGSTTLFLADEIVRRKGLIIITNSAGIAARCQKGEGNRVVLADGSKMGRAGVFEVCAMAAAGRIVTDSIKKPFRDAASAASVRVEISSLD